MGSDSSTSASARFAACDSATGRKEGVLFGVTRDSSGSVIGSTPVIASWSIQLATTRANRDSSVATLSTVDGAWQLCGIPLSRSITVREVLAGAFFEQTLELSPGHRESAVNFSTRGSGRLSDVLVTFAVVNTRGLPLPDATLQVSPPNGPKREFRTDLAGRAVAVGLAPGRLVVRARKIGFQPGDLAVPIDSGRNTVPVVLDEIKVPMLAAVRIVGDREVMARHQEFEMRRTLHQATLTITSLDIEKRNPVSTWEMLTGAASVNVIPYGTGVFAMSTRGSRPVQRPGITELSTAPCWYRVMIDGLALPDSMPDLSKLPPPSEIHGIEVFAGPSTIPPQYNSAIGGSGLGNGYCGLIAIWRK
jgi:hypothetical protein